jgi:hypothetical protein
MVLIDYHFDRLQFNKPRWNNERVNRLCWMYRITPYELARMCRIQKGMMTVWIKKNRYPAHVVLHFWQFECAFIEASLGGRKLDISPVYLLKERNEDLTGANGGNGVLADHLMDADAADKAGNVLERCCGRGTARAPQLR